MIIGDRSDFFISRVELHSRLLNSLGQLRNLTVRNVGKLVIQVTRPGCFCAKDCLDSVKMYTWWYTFTCTGGDGL